VIQCSIWHNAFATDGDLVVRGVLSVTIRVELNINVRRPPIWNNVSHISAAINQQVSNCYKITSVGLVTREVLPERLKLELIV